MTVCFYKKHITAITTTSLLNHFSWSFWSYNWPTTFKSYAWSRIFRAMPDLRSVKAKHVLQNHAWPNILT